MFVEYSTESKAYRLWRRGTIQLKIMTSVLLRNSRFVTQRSPQEVKLPLQSIDMEVETASERLSDDGIQRTDDNGLTDSIDYETSSDRKRVIELHDNMSEELSQNEKEVHLPQ